MDVQLTGGRRARPLLLRSRRGPDRGVGELVKERGGEVIRGAWRSRDLRAKANGEPDLAILRDSGRLDSVLA